MLHAVRITFVRFSEGENTMSRQTKVKFAALVTAVVTTMGTAGISAAVAAPDAGNNKPSFVKTNGSWCC